MQAMKASIRYNSIFTFFTHVGALLLIYTICRVLFFVFHYSYFADLPVGSFIFLLFASLRFDLSVIVLSNVLFILAYLFPAKIREKRNYRLFLKSLFLLINTIAILANCVDLAYFRFTLKRTTADVFHFFGGKIGNDLATLLPVFLKDYWYIFIIWILLSLLLLFLYNRIEKKRIPLLWSQREYTREINFFVIIIIFTVIAYRGGIQLKPISAIDAGEYANVKHVPLVTSTPFTLLKTIDVPTIEPATYFTDEKQMKRLYNPVKPAKEGVMNKKNVFIIILESFSKEYVGALNGRKEGYTPFLDSLINESLSFTNAYANAKRSIEGIPAVVAGIPNWMNEPFITSIYGSNRINSLPSLLKKQGYYSAFFHGGKNGTMGFEAFANMSGFDQYFGRKEYNNEAHYDGNWGIWDEEFLQYALNIMNNSSQPFLATLFTLSSHHPYSIPEKYTGKFKPGALPIHISIRYTDYALSRFFESAKKTAWFKNTLFVLVADHTSISDDAFYTNNVGNNAIPIIFYAGDQSLKAKDSTIIQQIDIMPSILDYLHYPQSYYSFGNSAFDHTCSHYAFSYGNDVFQLLEGNFAYRFNGEKTVDLYDVSKDSLLRHNLMNEQKEKSRELEEKSKAIIQTFQQALINNHMHIDN